MLNRSAQAVTGDATLDAAVVRWSMDSRLAPLFAVHGAGLLVLDEAGERVLRATNTAANLRAAITDTAGRILAGLRLAEQIRRAGPTDAGARLVRIRLDTRGIARPTACLIARTAPTDGLSDAPLLLLAPAEPLPALRSASPSPRIEAEPGSKTADASDGRTAGAAALPAPAGEMVPVPLDRLLWSSDADGVFTRLAGAEPALSTLLMGRSWQTLADQGAIVGDALLTALAERQTFRALPLVVRLAPAADEIDLEVSGAPSTRRSQPFAGFSGFGSVRGRRGVGGAAGAIGDAIRPSPPGPREAGDIDAPAPAPNAGDAEQAVAPPAGGAVAAAETPPADPDRATLPVPLDPSEAEPHSSSDLPVAPACPDVPAVVAEAGTDASPPGAARPSRGADLSTHEHAAFREIARALGARFAGDDEALRTPDEAVNDGRRGAIMPFPAIAPSSQNAAIEAAIVAALDRLPAGVLVHRDGSIVFANRRVLELTGFGDRAAMQAAGGLAPLFRDRAAEEAPAGDEPVSVTSGGGGLTGLLIERSRVDWEGKPAELLLVRAANAADPLREQAAQAMIEVREAAREREARALLEHVEEGVATLDAAGRILTLNRSAAALLAGDAREIVGEALADLFASESAAPVASSLREAHEAGTGEPRLVVPRGQAEALRLKIARLAGKGEPRFCATLRARVAAAPAALPPATPVPVPETAGPMLPRSALTDGIRAADFLARVSHEIRTPLNGILGFADAMLSEPLGPLGSERYRESLRDIRVSGEHVLGVVENLLDLARIEAGRVDLTFADLALNDVVSTCIAQMQPQAARDRIVVRTSLSPDLGPLSADERSMRQAALNVIAHAIRYTEAGGQVIVSTAAAERGEIAFRVRGTGTGMTEEEIADALEPFRSLDVAARAPGGTGLGLTLTKALVEANRGAFRISSRKNEGTLIEMTFPSRQARSA